jgi:hypothetical protein
MNQPDKLLGKAEIIEMAKFTKITGEILMQNTVLREYLNCGTISPGIRGGVFAGGRGIAPNSLREFGIILPKGGMIFPQEDRDCFLELLGKINAAVLQQRLDEEVGYIRKVLSMIERSTIPNIGVVELKKELNVLGLTLSSGREASIVLDGHQALPIFAERRDEGRVTIEFLPLEQVEEFLNVEEKMCVIRTANVARIKSVADSRRIEWYGYKKTPGWIGWMRQSGERISPSVAYSVYSYTFRCRLDLTNLNDVASFEEMAQNKS